LVDWEAAAKSVGLQAAPAEEANADLAKEAAEATVAMMALVGWLGRNSNPAGRGEARASTPT
jgi:hypothetical protein